MAAGERRLHLGRVVFVTLVVLAPTASALLAENATDPLDEARSLLEGGREEEAGAIVTRVLASDPTDPDVLAGAALMLRDLRRFEDAVAAARRAVGLRPEDPKFRLGLARALLESARQLKGEEVRKTRFSEAASAFAIAAETDPAADDAVAGWADALGLAGRHAEAIPIWERLIQFDPDRKDGYLGLAKTLDELNRREEWPALAARAKARNEALGWQVALGIYDMASSDGKYEAADSLLPILRATARDDAAELGVWALDTIAHGSYEKALARLTAYIAAGPDGGDAEIVANAVVGRGLKDLPPPKRLPKRREVSTAPGDVLLPKLVRKVEPVYPAEFESLGIEGKVIVDVVVRTNGAIGRMKLLEYTHPSFAVAALDAVKRWHYSPALQDGRPVAIYYTIHVNFRVRSKSRSRKGQG